VIDVGVTVVAVISALLIRFDTTDFREAVVRFMPVILLPVLLRPAVYLIFGLYRREWRFASVRELRDVGWAILCGSVLIVASYVALAALGAVGTRPFPRSFFILEPILSFAGIAGVRFVLRSMLERRVVASKGGTRAGDLPTLVYGAGDAGAMVARLVHSGDIAGIRIMGYLDDDPRKMGSRLMGYRVFGGLDRLADATERTGATQLVVAMPSSAGRPVRRAVVASQAQQLTVKTIPQLRDLITGGLQFSGLRSVSVEDLLRREPFEIDSASIASAINGASVLVTGGGGSIGGELVRQIATLGPRLLTIVDSHEWALWTAERDLEPFVRDRDGTDIDVVLADVRSPSGMEAVLRRARPDIVFHAAALKHVPYVESYPSEGVLTNIGGTQTLLRLCEVLGVPKFVLISTDKAVEPSSIMGATKRVAELLTEACGARSGRPYVVLRFGNVLGSSGSVVPLLQRQLRDGLPLTITQPDATRYFMTISEAVNLILQAAVDPSPGEVYVLDMGEPVRIDDLARDLVRLHGLDPTTVTFSITGLRPGERMHERLFYASEVARPTRHPGILRATPSAPGPSATEIEDFASELEQAARDHDDQAIRLLLQRKQFLAPLDVSVGSR
jgi:FlaA1/EpsC-like NDP-sugar epimerase